MGELLEESELSGMLDLRLGTAAKGTWTDVGTELDTERDG